MNTSGSFIVGGMDRSEWGMRLAVWDQHGLTDEQILMAIKARFEKLPASAGPSRGIGVIKFFDGPIADFARDLKSGKAQVGASGAKPNGETREQRRKRIARMIGA